MAAPSSDIRAGRQNFDRYSGTGAGDRNTTMLTQTDPSNSPVAIISCGAFDVSEIRRQLIQRMEINYDQIYDFDLRDWLTLNRNNEGKADKPRGKPGTDDQTIKVVVGQDNFAEVIIGLMGSIDKHSLKVVIVFDNRGIYRGDVVGRFLEATMGSWLFNNDRPFIRAKHFSSVDNVQRLGDNTMGPGIATLVASVISYLVNPRGHREPLSTWGLPVHQQYGYEACRKTSASCRQFTKAWEFVFRSNAGDTLVYHPIDNPSRTRLGDGGDGDGDGHKAAGDGKGKGGGGGYDHRKGDDGDYRGMRGKTGVSGRYRRRDGRKHDYEP